MLHCRVKVTDSAPTLWVIEDLYIMITHCVLDFGKGSCTRHEQTQINFLSFGTMNEAKKWIYTCFATSN